MRIHLSWLFILFTVLLSSGSASPSKAIPEYRLFFSKVQLYLADIRELFKSRKSGHTAEFFTRAGNSYGYGFTLTASSYKPAAAVNTYPASRHTAEYMHHIPMHKHSGAANRESFYIVLSRSLHRPEKKAPNHTELSFTEDAGISFVSLIK